MEVDDRIENQGQQGRNLRGILIRSCQGIYRIPFHLGIDKIDNLLGVKRIDVKDRRLRVKIITGMGKC